MAIIKSDGMAIHGQRLLQVAVCEVFMPTQRVRIRERRIHLNCLVYKQDLQKQQDGETGGLTRFKNVMADSWSFWRLKQFPTIHQVRGDCFSKSTAS